MAIPIWLSRGEDADAAVFKQLTSAINGSSTGVLIDPTGQRVERMAGP